VTRPQKVGLVLIGAALGLVVGVVAAVAATLADALD